MSSDVIWMSLLVPSVLMLFPAPTVTFAGADILNAVRLIEPLFEMIEPSITSKLAPSCPDRIVMSPSEVTPLLPIPIGPET